MPRDRIDEHTDDEAVDTVGGEFGPFSHSSRDDSGRGGAEHCLENKER